MIDYGTCSLAHIKPCEESYLDAIRVIFKKHLRNEAMSFCAELKKLGYKVFAQLVSVTSYTDDEMMDLIRLANEVKPYAVSMVDTYGLMHQNNLKHYFANSTRSSSGSSHSSHSKPLYGYSHGDSNHSSDSYNVHDYDDPEDFYYDNEDDFDGIDDAETYFYDHND